MDRGANYVTRLARGKTSAAVRPASRRKDDSGMDIMNPHAPAAQWLRIHSEGAPVDVIDLHRPVGEALALCLIGLIAMIPSMLRHRGEIGGSHTGRRRRSYRDSIPPSPERQARHRVLPESEADKDQNHRPGEEFPLAALSE
jgi:hypothetical protein